MSPLEQQAELLANNVSGWETSVLKRLGERIKQCGKMSIADIQSFNNIAVVKQDMRAITKDLAMVTGFNASQIEKMYSDALEAEHLENKPLYDYRNMKFTSIEENRELKAIVKAYSRTTAEEMVNLSKTSVLKMIDETGKVQPLEKVYKNTIDKAVMQVASGGTDFHTAMKDTIRALGGNGISVQYESGLTRRLDSAVRQNILWGAKQASIEYNDIIGKELGCDGIEIDWHSFPRPSHEDMQGKQYSIKGRKVINGVVYEDAYEQGIDGEGGLLNDYGCKHEKTPIICGISEPRYDKEELERLNEQNKQIFEIDGKEYTGYEASQSMRKLETAIREQESIKQMAKASGTKGLIRECDENIMHYRSKYSQISDVTGIKEDVNRLTIVNKPKKLSETVNGATPTPKKVDLPKKKFKKAETIEEAIIQANDLGVKYAQFKKMPLEQAQNAIEAVRTLPKDCVPKAIANGADVQTLTDRPLGRKSDQWWGVTYDYRLFSLRTMQLGYPTTDIDGGLIVGLNTTKFKTMESLTKAKIEANEKYFAKTGRYWNFNTNGEATAFHEIGHCYVNVRGLPQDWEKLSEQWAEESMCDLLKKPDEAFAEAWAAFHLGDERLPNYISDIIRGLS